MKSAFIHIGMHKTATTTMQKIYFPIIQAYGDNIVVNEPTVYRYLEKCWKFDIYERTTEFHEVQNHLKSISSDNILISMEAFCGDLFNGYKIENYEEKLLHLKELFSETKLELLFARRDLPGWIISCYKESIKEHHYKPFNSFIANFGTNEVGMPVVKAFSIPTLCEKLRLKITVFEFDQIKENDKIIANYLLEQTNNNVALLLDAKSEVQNQGYSFQAIAFILALNKYCSWLLPNGIFFKGPKSIYKIEYYWNNNFVLRYCKKLGFPLWRGRWFRFIMIRLDRSRKFRTLMNKQTIELNSQIEKFLATW